MPTVLITGAGRGIGLELARAYAEADWSVLAGIRDPAAADTLIRIDGDVTPITLDVADPASVMILAERLAGLPIDLLINNAGIIGPRDAVIGDTDFGVWQDVLTVNTLAPVRLVEAFLPHLRDGNGRTIVTVSSKMGSIGANQRGGALIYRSSKAAVNAAMRSIAFDLADESFTVTVLHPGWVRTDMGGPQADIGAVESAIGMKAVIDGLTPDQTGQFFNYDGTALPW